MLGMVEFLALHVLIIQIPIMSLINTDDNFMRIFRLNNISLNVCGQTSRYNLDEMARIYQDITVGSLICAVM